MVSFPWYSSAAQSSQTSKPEPKPKPEPEPKSEPSLKALWEQSREWLGQQPVERVVGITCLSIIGWRVGVRLLRRYPNATSITQEMIRSKRWIKGKVVEYIVFGLFNTFERTNSISALMTQMVFVYTTYPRYTSSPFPTEEVMRIS